MVDKYFYSSVERDTKVLCDLLGYNSTQRKTREPHIKSVLTDVHRDGYISGLRGADYIKDRFKEVEKEKQSYIGDLLEVNTLLKNGKIEEALGYLSIAIGGLI